MIVDTHCHLDEEDFRHDLSNVLVAARSAGVSRMITIGTTLKTSCCAVELAAQHSEIYASVGIHPNYVSQAQTNDWDGIRELTQNSRVVALGETGLDCYWDYSPLELQQTYFRKHLELSIETGLPFVVHCRNAEAEVMKLLREFASRSPLRGVMHSFSGDAAMADECVELGLYLSFSGMLTFKRNDGLREVAGRVPADRILVETDAPYLAPLPHRGKRNEPAYSRFTLNCLAQARGMVPEELASITSRNAEALFKLPRC